MTAPSRATTAGRAYLDLREKARQDRRPVDELMQLYVLESFLARLASSGSADRFVLKGGVLLAIFGQRRPTRDIDLKAQSIANDPATVRAAITDIAATSLDDGVVFDTRAATAAAIREEDQYQAVRVSMTASLATARPSFHVDVSVGDPITPEPQIVQLPRILGGTLGVQVGDHYCVQIGQACAENPGVKGQRLACREQIYFAAGAGRAGTAAPQG